METNPFAQLSELVDEKMAQYRAEMQIHAELLETQRQQERLAHEDKNRAAMESFMSSLASKQQDMFNEMLKQLGQNKRASEAASKDEDIYPPLSPQPQSTAASSTPANSFVPQTLNVEEQQEVMVSCEECNQTMTADGKSTRCATCMKTRQAPAFTYRHNDDASPSDSSDDDEEDPHRCIDCGDRLNAADNTLRCPPCHHARMNKSRKKSKTAVKKEVHASSSGFDDNYIKKVVERMRALPVTQTPSRPAAKNISRHEQEAQLLKIKVEAEEIDRVSASTSDDLAEEAASVLGNVLSRAFSPSQRQMFRYTKTPNIIMTARDRMAAVKETKDFYGTFSGDRAAAPKFLRDMCAQIQKYDFNIGEVFQMLTLTMKGEAAAWFTAEWSECCRLPESDKPVQILFHRFIDRWMDGLARRAFRDQLAHTRLQSDRVSQSDLQMHYSKFVETVNNLKMCDRHVVMSDLIEDYYKSLPNVCKSFIGGDFKNATSIEDIQRKAEQALAFMLVTSTPKQDGSLPKPITVHAMPTSPSSTPPSPRQRNRRNQNQPVKIRQCYHCGSTEHWTGIDCPVFAQPQTNAGKALWKKRNDEKGASYEYDKQYFERMSRDIQAQRERRRRNSEKQPPRQRQFTPRSDPAGTASAQTQVSTNSGSQQL